MKRLLLAPLLLVTGCHGYLLPFDERGMVAITPLETAGGERLDLDAEGNLTVRPGAADVSAVLGVGLFETPGGLVVTNQLRPGVPLEPEDRILYAAPALPLPLAQRVRQAHRAALGEQVDLASQQSPISGTLPQRIGWGNLNLPLTQLSLFERYDPTQVRRWRPVPLEGKDAVASRPRPRADTEPPLPTPAQLRKKRTAHPVRTLADLRGYLCGTGWLKLDLLVLRRGKEVVVRHALREETRWLPVRLWRPQMTRWHGFDLVRVRDLPEDSRPEAAKPEEFLVVRVARDAPAGHAGLRPLDVVPPRSLVVMLGGPANAWKLLGHNTPPPREGQVNQILSKGRLFLGLRDRHRMSPEETPVEVRAPDGQVKKLRFALREPPRELWIPFFFSYQTDGVRTHLGIGPFDLFFHYSSRREYDGSSDSFRRYSRWAVGSSVGGIAEESKRGVVDSGGVNPLTDVVRLDFLFEWADAPQEVRKRQRGTVY